MAYKYEFLQDFIHEPRKDEIVFENVLEKPIKFQELPDYRLDKLINDIREYCDSNAIPIFENLDVVKLEQLLNV